MKKYPDSCPVFPHSYCNFLRHNNNTNQSNFGNLPGSARSSQLFVGMPIFSQNQLFGTMFFGGSLMNMMNNNGFNDSSGYQHQLIAAAQQGFLSGLNYRMGRIPAYSSFGLPGGVLQFNLPSFCNSFCNQIQGPFFLIINGPWYPSSPLPSQSPPPPPPSPPQQPTHVPQGQPTHAAQPTQSYEIHIPSGRSESGWTQIFDCDETPPQRRQNNENADTIRNEISNRPSHTPTNTDCPICMEVISAEVRMITDCGHAFCSYCLTRWLRYGFTCPLCCQELSY